MQTDSSFADVYAQWLAPATRLATSLTRDRATAEDIAAESLLRVWRHHDAGHVAQPWGYVRRTVVNATIDRGRRAGRERAALERVESGTQASHETSILNRDLVARLLAELPPMQRRIVALRFLDDRSERQTAEELGISVGAVKSGTSRALARMRAAHAGLAEVALAA